MNADEIVKALRCYASDCGDADTCGQCTFAWMCEEMDGNAPKIIADLIERLNNFEHSQRAVLLARIAELEAQLANARNEPEVLRGKWIKGGADDMHGFDFHCSKCNKSFHLGSLATIYDVEREWIHCPSCGACMIGGEDDGQA